MQEKTFFTQQLMSWFADNARDLPWKQTKDPYVIWLSEIILQQTRVEQGTPYFLKFVKSFPTIKDMANADLDLIMSLWEGLGYYSRARNMHSTAQYIDSELNGEFPTEYNVILSLKGIGPYTAAAISSFAYDKVYPVIDGNVIRVLSRYFGILDFVDETIVKKHIQQLAEKCIDQKNPANYNQAIMDFGSLVCSPKKTNCQECVLQEKCQAFQFDNVSIIPRKSKKIKKRNRYLHFFIISKDDQVLLEKRIKKDIWQELYQFPLLESKDSNIVSLKSMKSVLKSLSIIDYTVIDSSNKIYRQTLTHQNIYAIFYHIHVNEPIKTNSHPYYLVDFKNLRNFAFPRIVNDCPFLEEIKNKSYDQ